MLEKISFFIENIHQLNQPEAGELYEDAMALATSLAAHPANLVTEEARAAAYEQASAAQELAYAYFLQHGQPIAEGAIDPDSFDIGFIPPGGATPVLSRSELQKEILIFLRTHYPHTLPLELRLSGSKN